MKAKLESDRVIVELTFAEYARVVTALGVTASIAPKLLPRQSREWFKLLTDFSSAAPNVVEPEEPQT